MAQMFRSTLSMALALVAALALFATNAQAQSGLRFSPGGSSSSVPYSTSTSILDLMPAPPTEAAQQGGAAAAAPEPSSGAASGSQQTPAAPATATETAIHQGLAPEKANPATGLGATRGTPAAPSDASVRVPTDAPNPYTPPRSPGGGLKIR